MGNLAASRAELIDGSLTLGVTAAPLSATSVPCTLVVVRANPDNAGRALVGNSSSQSMPLDAGDSEAIWTTDLTKVHAKTNNAGDTLEYHAFKF